jgi:hypothetical protein
MLFNYNCVIEIRNYLDIFESSMTIAEKKKQLELA